MFELFALAMLIIIAALLAWSGLRAWRAKNGFIKWGGTSLAALLSTAVTLISLITDRRAVQAACPQCPGPDHKSSRHA